MKMISPVPESAYSKAVTAKLGTLLFVSGQESIDEKGKLIAPGDFTGQIQQVWKNLRTVLKKAGGEIEQVATMTVYTTEGIQWRSGHNLLVELMGAGEYPVSVVIYPERAEQLKAKGQTVEWVKSTDPILVNMDIMGIAAKAPHPNAAKLFFNYVLSKEAQMILHSRHRISARSDIPPLVPTMEPKKLPLIPLDPAIPTNANIVREFRSVFGLR